MLAGESPSSVSIVAISTLVQPYPNVRSARASTISRASRPIHRGTRRGIRGRVCRPRGTAPASTGLLAPPRDPAAVEQTLLKAGQRNPQDTTSYTRLGAFYQEQGHYRQAAYVYTRLLALAPDSAVGRLQLAYAYAHLGQTREGAEQERIARHLLARDKEEASLLTRRDAHPTDPAARLALARHYVRAGQFAKAQIEVESAYCLAPHAAPVRQEWNAFYTALGMSPPAASAGVRR